MLLQSDVLIALPGGIGTLDEIFSVAAAHTIGYHNKRVIIYNMKGFWDSTIRMLDDLQSQGLIRGSWRNYIQIANSMEQIQLLIS
jgi:predicted Rossmann-fold nucleotide-binding protein